MKNNHIPIPDTKAFDATVTKLREFFHSKGYVECSVQDRRSILAACEDPDTVATFNYQGTTWPLPQTGQMWLEYELLSQPDVKGVFCLSTSYRAEPNPVPGRHEVIFPMFEFEGRGGMDELRQVEKELVEFLGFESPVILSYADAQEKYGVEELEHIHENQMYDDFDGKPVSLEFFPEFTAPFWNMKRAEDGTANKIDLILGGQETIGSAERSCDKQIMRDSFYTINGGGYSKKLFDLFGTERVEKELEEFLEMDFFERFGGGIGVTRMMQAMKKENLL